MGLGIPCTRLVAKTVRVRSDTTSTGRGGRPSSIREAPEAAMKADNMARRPNLSEMSPTGVCKRRVMPLAAEIIDPHRSA